MKLYPLFLSWYTLIFLITISAFLASCGDEQGRIINGDGELITLDFTREYDGLETRLDEIAQDIELIHLETTPESLLRSVRGVFSENFILCLSGVRALLFDRNGHFLGKIGQKGKGPDEYWDNSRWAIDEKNNLIYCYNSYNSKLIRYSLDNRQMENSFATETDGSLQGMIILNADSIFAIKHVNRMFPYQYYYLTTNGKFLEGKVWDTTRYFHSGMYSTPFLQQDQNNRIILQPSNNDTIFEVWGINAHPLITFKKKNFPKKGDKVKINRFFLKGLDADRNAMVYMSEDERIMDGDFIVTSNHLDHSLYRYHSKSQDMEKIVSLIFDLHGLELKLDQYYFRVRGFNSFYISIPILDILELCNQYLSNNPEPERAAMVRELQESLDINSNPLLVTGQWNR